MTLTITADKLAGIAGASAPNDLMRSLVDPLTEHMGAAGILNSRLQTVHFLAQGCHETDHFKTLVEYGQPTYFERYDGRADLGNLREGWGYRYRGRGFFQLTGANNYDVTGRALGLPLFEQPNLAADPATSVRIAVHYWLHRKIGPWAETDNVIMVTRRVNGGTNGLADRKAALARAREAYPRAPDWVNDPPIPTTRPA